MNCQWVPEHKKITEVLSRHPLSNDVIAKSNMAAADHDENPTFGVLGLHARQAKMCNLKVHMITSGQNKVSNEFRMQKLVLKMVLHLHLHASVIPLLA